MDCNTDRRNRSICRKRKQHCTDTDSIRHYCRNGYIHHHADPRKLHRSTRYSDDHGESYASCNRYAIQPDDLLGCTNRHCADICACGRNIRMDGGTNRSDRCHCRQRQQHYTDTDHLRNDGRYSYLQHHAYTYRLRRTSCGCDRDGKSASIGSCYTSFTIRMLGCTDRHCTDICTCGSNLHLDCIPDRSHGSHSRKRNQHCTDTDGIRHYCRNRNIYHHTVPRWMYRTCFHRNRDSEPEPCDHRHTFASQHLCGYIRAADSYGRDKLYMVTSDGTQYNIGKHGERISCIDSRIYGDGNRRQRLFWNGERTGYCKPGSSHNSISRKHYLRGRISKPYGRRRSELHLVTSNGTQPGNRGKCHCNPSCNHHLYSYWNKPRLLEHSNSYGYS